MTTVTLADGVEVAARLRPVDDGVDVFGAVIELDPQPPRGRAGSVGPDVLAELPGLVGHSRAWRDVAAGARALLATDVPVVVVGERGTGKLAVLQAALSVTSARGDVAVVDAASEPLDGTRAWLAACAARLADRDVLIIRHLDALSDEATAALAAILDTSATTCRALGTLSTADERIERDGLARLLDRLGAGRLTIPPLRARRSDLPDLIAALTRRHGGDRSVPRWTADALGALRRAEWPGNVRQLEGVIRGVLATCRGPHIRASDLPEDVRRRVVQAGRTELERLELEAIRTVLREHAGNKRQAARALGISRSTLYRKLEAFAPELG
jgi:DNA-binding NtrC family response regulator